ncbi:DUF4383 domain-containing protein [Georgenia faecalis]|uniref:DUF4383 domain-containing protein n=1 Tax=Georgenia faecalis TaxID=2483799 RepID=A0ABV9DCY0_9MICO|nr:DUF4383 domain-containing protein [Georgenia faecalis]
MANSTTTTRRQPHQLLALVIGVVYLLVGIAGFFVTGIDGFVEHDHDQTLLVFAINPLHNIVHIVIGLAGVILWSTPERARVYGWLLAIGYGAATIYGFIVLNNDDLNFLNINMADNWLHLVSTIAGLIIALWPRRDTRTTTGRR